MKEIWRKRDERRRCLYRPIGVRANIDADWFDSWWLFFFFSVFVVGKLKRRQRSPLNPADACWHCLNQTFNIFTSNEKRSCEDGDWDAFAYPVQSRLILRWMLKRIQVQSTANTFLKNLIKVINFLLNQVNFYIFFASVIDRLPEHANEGDGQVSPVFHSFDGRTKRRHEGRAQCKSPIDGSQSCADWSN